MLPGCILFVPNRFHQAGMHIMKLKYRSKRLASRSPWQSSRATRVAGLTARILSSNRNRERRSECSPEELLFQDHASWIASKP